MLLNKNEKYLISGSADMTAKVFDVTSGTCIKTFQGQTSFIEDIQLNHDETILFTLSKKGLIQHKLDIIDSFPDHNDKISDIKQCLETRRVVVGSNDGVIKTYDMDTFECVQEFKLGFKITIYNISKDLK